MEPPRMPYPRSFSARLHVYSNINLCLASINHDHEIISVQVLYASAWCGWVVISRSIGDLVFSCREMKWSIRSCLVQNVTVLKFSSALTRSDLQINCFLFFWDHFKTGYKCKLWICDPFFIWQGIYPPLRTRGVHIEWSNLANCQISGLVIAWEGLGHATTAWRRDNSRRNATGTDRGSVEKRKEEREIYNRDLPTL